MCFFLVDPKVGDILSDIENLTLSEQYTVYIALLNKLKRDEKTLLEHCQNVHSIGEFFLFKVHCLAFVFCSQTLVL